MITATEIIRSAPAEICRPWLRHILPHADWIALAQTAPAEGWTLLAHWADTALAHALFLDPDSLRVVPVSTLVEAGRYPALSPYLPAAALYQRMVHDLWGHVAEGAADLRPWLDHGNWPLSPPMAIRPESRPPGAPPLLTGPEQDDAMILPLGPIWGQLDEAAHLRLTLHGPIVRYAEALLGFTHKGALTLMRGKSTRAAARFAARLAADATVAHSVAFAQAAESALDVEVPQRAIGLRIAMMEIERIAIHLDNLTEVARLAGAGTVRTKCGTLREVLLRATATAFGHRLMMDCVIPGGVAADIDANGPEAILRALGTIASELPTLRRLHDGPALSSRLVGLARTRGARGGVTGRASGHAFDVRTNFAPGYAGLMPRTAVLSEGDAAARQRLRLLEIEESLRLIGLTMDLLPAGPTTATLPQVSGEGIGCAESSRGDIWHSIQLDHGQIAAVFVRDPGWDQWPLAEQALRGAEAEDIDLIRTSLALPASGIDL